MVQRCSSRLVVELSGREPICRLPMMLVSNTDRMALFTALEKQLMPEALVYQD